MRLKKENNKRTASTKLSADQLPTDGELTPQLISSTRPFFLELLNTALQKRRLKAPHSTQDYLVSLLEHYISAANLFLASQNQIGESGRHHGTLAEMYLLAANAESHIRLELLKKLGDTALYVSGFFGDSLQNKLIDVDYYVEMGGSAYSALATGTNEKKYAAVYTDLSSRFLMYVDVLTHISQQAMIQTNQDILRLYNRYLVTGSKLAAEQLIEMGILTTVPTSKMDRQQ